MAKNNTAIITVIIVFAAFCLLTVCIAGVGFVGFRFFSQTLVKSRDESVRVQLRNLDAAVEVYSIRHNGIPPQQLQELLVGDKFGGPILKFEKDLFDPWDMPFQYDPGGPRNNGERPDIWTETRDGRIIGNWQNKK